MHPYLQETEYAVRGLFDLIGDEEAQCKQTRLQVEETQKERARAQAILHHGAPPTGFGEDTTPYFEKKVRDARRDIAALESELARLEAAALAKAFSVHSLAGAVLQIAKQGIVVAHGSLASCPQGKNVGPEVLKNVIWQARNQALHWEDGSFNPQVTACFMNLEQAFGAKLQLGRTPAVNLAKDVLDLLQWNSYEAYLLDMSTLIL